MKLPSKKNIIIVGVVILAGAIGYFSSLILKSDDGIVEEICEEIIQSHANVDVDLTPASPEK